MAAAAPAPSRWLFGPIPDLFLGCGLLYAAVFLLFGMAGPQLRSLDLDMPLRLGVILFSMPHYGATLLRVYEQRQERRSYAIFSVWTTLLVAALFVVGVYNVLIASLLVTVYLTWSPWHYTGQNYGLAVMFLRRRGVDLTPTLKRWVYASFVLSFVLTFLVMHGSAAPGYDPFSYEGSEVAFLPLGIPATIGTLLVSTVGGAYLVATAVAAFVLLRRSGFRAIAPVAALALTQALWFSVPFAVRYFGWHTGIDPIDKHSVIADYILLIFVGHGIQYLWVTAYYARAAQRWRGIGNYWLKTLACGTAIWTLPVAFFAADGIGKLSFDGGMALLVAAGVNIHHFILDGAIWKLRNSRIASVLIRNESHDVATPGGVPWGRRAVWTVACLGLAMTFFEFYEFRIAYPAALRAKDYAGAGAILDRLAWVGHDRANNRVKLGVGYERAGDLEAAARYYGRALELHPTASLWGALGSVEERLENWSSAIAAYESALDLDGSRAEFLHGALASIARRRGECESAIHHYREALRVRPKSRRRSNDLAWALATCPDPALRKPDESVRLAEGVRDSGEPDPNVLDTLAAAYAAAGRFDEAVHTASQAVELADARGKADLSRDIGAKLALYRDRRPFVEAPSIREGG